ncbi:unnamed protein product, partial [Mesorhabditis spiculigera]
MPRRLSNIFGLIFATMVVILYISSPYEPGIFMIKNPYFARKEPPRFRMPDYLASIDCRRLFERDVAYIEELSALEGKLDPRLMQRIVAKEEPIVGSCVEIRARIIGDYPAPFLNYSVAFARNIYEEFETLEILLAATYSPENHYCYHVDVKSTPKFKAQMETLQTCFPNVYLVKEQFDVSSSGFNNNMAHYKCMEVLLEKPGWEYLILLQAHDLVAHTNLELMKMLRLLNGTNDNDMEDIPWDRVAPGLSFEIKDLNLWTQHTNLTPAEREKAKLKFAKGLEEATYMRAAIHWMVKEMNITTLIERFNQGPYAVDELAFATLANSETLRMPGGYHSACLENRLRDSFFTYITRHTRWIDNGYEGCHERHQICLYGIEDLQEARRIARRVISLNKFLGSHDFVAIACMAESLFNRTHGSEEDFDVEYIANHSGNGHIILGAIFVFCLVVVYLLRPDNAVSVLMVPFQTTSVRGIPRKAQTPSPNATCSPVDVGWIDADSSQRYLVAYMQMHHGGNQMGNLVFELLGLVGIAKVLGRLPVIVLGSEYDHGARPQFWDNLLYYPNLYSGVRFVCDPGFNDILQKDSYRQASFLAWDDSYPVLQRVLESENDAQLFVAIIDMVQTSRYYEIMGKEDLRARLAVPELTRRVMRVKLFGLTIRWNGQFRIPRLTLRVALCVATFLLVCGCCLFYRRSGSTTCKLSAENSGSDERSETSSDKSSDTGTDASIDTSSETQASSSGDEKVILEKVVWNYYRPSVSLRHLIPDREPDPNNATSELTDSNGQRMIVLEGSYTPGDFAARPHLYTVAIDIGENLTVSELLQLQEKSLYKNLFMYVDSRDNDFFEIMDKDNNTQIRLMPKSAYTRLGNLIVPRDPEFHQRLWACSRKLECLNRYEKYLEEFPWIDRILCAAVLYGHVFHVPCDPDAVLVAGYGQNWRADRPSAGYGYESKFVANGRFLPSELSEVYRNF